MNSYWEVTSQILIGLWIFFGCYFGHDFTLSYHLLFLLIFQWVLFIIFVLSLLVWINKPYDFSPHRKIASSWMALWWSTRLASQVPPAETSLVVMTGCVTNSVCVPTERSSECRWQVRTWAARPQTTLVETRTRRTQEDINRFILWLIFLRLGMHIMFLQSLW